MGVRLTSHWTAAAFTGLLSVPGWGWVKGEWMNEWMNGWMNFSFNFWKSGAHGGMILTGENRRTRRKTCPSATLSTTNPTGLTRARTQATAVRGRWLTAWAMARPWIPVNEWHSVVPSEHGTLHALKQWTGHTNRWYVSDCLHSAASKTNWRVLVSIYSVITESCFDYSLSSSVQYYCTGSNS
jgi:hypothetical protein